MKAISHEYFVSLEVAKLLKEAGFNWDTYSAYNKDGVFADKNRRITTWNDFADYYSAPTPEVAQRWLREIKSFDVLVLFQWLGDRSIAYKYELRLFGRPYALPEIIFDSYEVAQETGIKKALEIILEKGK